ncbi:unnamed protein product [Nezara viridula]|uniref:Uncharacterized protein n=1 Tax=Nezara viridula TaxID=85310 RepID=A0A9P0MZR6_NEZVI|nr:unnamed protein product [Nezara viridula]
MEKKQTIKGVERPGETDETESAMEQLVVEAPRQKEEGRIIEEDRREECPQKKEEEHINAQIRELTKIIVGMEAVTKFIEEIKIDSLISAAILKAKRENEQEIKQGDAMNQGIGEDARVAEKSTLVTRCMPVPMAHRNKNIRIARGRNFVTSDVDSEEEELLPGMNVESQKKDLIDVREGRRADDQ